MAETPDISLFPGILRTLATAGFVDEAIKLAATWGGTKRFIPYKPTPESEISKIIGVKAAQVLAVNYGTSHHDIPLLAGLGRKKLALKWLGGLEVTDAARAVGCTARYVRMVRNGATPRTPKSNP
ncbi:conserved hypothetical protein [uncultured Alphaproteobacteria bacterium]|uniref:Uncharacterized protein n=1 Tax=uncultured Alphaproteobacteria bacterium TaxID=91750 RepID=A0A212JNN6_9PROT|nr:conserved hypothetical protein [uncultured Alphaproteobacteria bacterium]